MKLCDPELLRPLRSQLKSHASSGIASEAGIARHLLDLLDAAMAHADRLAAAERNVVDTSMAWRELDSRQHGRITNAETDALDARIAAHADACDRLRDLRHTPVTIDGAEPRHYPITVVQDRYGGSYSRGAWVAWYCDASEVPPEPDDEDGPARTFWEDMRSGRDAPVRPPFGIGDTPGEAVADLCAKLDEAERRAAG